MNVRRPVSLIYFTDDGHAPPSQAKVVGRYSRLLAATGTPCIVGALAFTKMPWGYGEIAGLFLVFGAILSLIALILGLIALSDNGRRERAGFWGVSIACINFLLLLLLLPVLSIA